MSVDCSAVIGWGYIPDEDDEKILREKFGDISSAIEEFEENWEEYPFETCCRDNYLGRFANNYLFGLTFIETDYFDCFLLKTFPLMRKEKKKLKKVLKNFLNTK